MGVLALSALILAGAGFVLFSQSAPNYKPGQKKVLADLKAIREEVLKMSGDLAPLRKEDLETLSTKEVQASVRKRFVTNYRGIFTTIFDEQVVAYHYRKYLSNKRDALFFAKTTRYEFFCWMHREEVQIVVNDQQLGKYDEERGMLTGARTNKIIAKLDRQAPEGGASIIIQGKQVGRMHPLKPQAKDALSQRVFEFVKNEISAEEEAIVLAIAFIEMIKIKVNH